MCIRIVNKASRVGIEGPSEELSLLLCRLAKLLSTNEQWRKIIYNFYDRAVLAKYSYFNGTSNRVACREK